MAVSKPLLLAEELNQESEISINIGYDRLLLSLSTKLGEGAFGSVYKARDERGRYFAVKMIKCTDVNTSYSVGQEIGILMKLKHDNIVTMYAFDFLGSTAVIVMEFCDGGTLNEELSNQPLLLETKLSWMAQLVQGLLYLHNNHIVHRDLKTENILILKDKNILKISDFGISRQFVCLKGNNVYDKNDDSFISEYLNAYMGTFAGTPFWVAPEVFNQKYNEYADIFSLGTIFFAILEESYCKFYGKQYYGLFVKHHGKQVGIGLAMFETNQEIIPNFEKTGNAKLKNIVSQMVRYEPEKRSSLIDLCDSVNMVYGEYLQRQEEGNLQEKDIGGDFEAYSKYANECEDRLVHWKKKLIFLIMCIYCTVLHLMTISYLMQAMNYGERE